MWGTVGCGPILGHLGTLNPLHNVAPTSLTRACRIVKYINKHRTNTVVERMSTLQELLPGDPTCILNALQSNIKQLGPQSVLEDCLKAHVDNAHPSIAMMVNGLPYKSIYGELTPSTNLKEVFAGIFSPTKTPVAAPVLQPAAAAENLADRMDNAADGTPGARLPAIAQAGAARLGAPMPTAPDSSMKLLVDQSKIGAAVAPLMPFLRSIIDCQSELFKSHIEALRNKHPIMIAISSCDVDAFRNELEKIFDMTFPRDERKRCLVKDIMSIEYIEETMCLLDLRTIAFSMNRRIRDLFDTEALTAQKDAMTDELRAQLIRVIMRIKNGDIRREIKDRFVGKDINELTIDVIAHVLHRADIDLRDRDPSYPPKLSSIPVHNSMPGKAPRNAPRTDKGPPCAACQAIWGWTNYHSLENCHSNPVHAAERGEQIKIRRERYVTKHGKQPGTYDWSKKRSAGPPANASPMKRGGGAGGSAGGGMGI